MGGRKHQVNACRSRELGIQEFSLQERWEMVLLIVDRNPMKKGNIHTKDIIVLARLILTWSAAVKEEKQARATVGSFVRCGTLSMITWTRKECMVRPT